jgi:hypothetical protein
MITRDLLLFAHAGRRNRTAWAKKTIPGGMAARRARQAGDRSNLMSSFTTTLTEKP